MKKQPFIPTRVFTPFSQFTSLPGSNIIVEVEVDWHALRARYRVIDTERPTDKMLEPRWQKIKYGKVTCEAYILVNKKRFYLTPSALNTQWNVRISELEMKTPELLYQFLGRLKADCEYYLGFGHRNPKKLWTGDVRSHISIMRDIYRTLCLHHEAPQYISEAEIDHFAIEMTRPIAKPIRAN